MATALRRFIPVVIRATPQRRQCVQPPAVLTETGLALEAAHGGERLREQHRSLIQTIWGRLKSLNSLVRRLRDFSDLARSGINCSEAAL
jgi:hypothetical protein